jgi:hypothetical protein
MYASSAAFQVEVRNPPDKVSRCIAAFLDGNFEFWMGRPAIRIGRDLYLQDLTKTEYTELLSRLKRI